MDVADFFFELYDPRQDGKCYHVLSDIVLIVLCEYLADCEGFVEVYAYDKQETLKEFLELPCGIPSHDTLGRVFCLLDPLQLESLLMRWGKQIVGLLVGKQLRAGRQVAHY
jgi:hypothetical protein